MQATTAVTTTQSVRTSPSGDALEQLELRWLLTPKHRMERPRPWSRVLWQSLVAKNNKNFTNLPPVYLCAQCFPALKTY